jgi:hypothetical protein
LAQRRLQGQPCASGAERAHRHQSPFWSPLITDHRDEHASSLMIDWRAARHLTSRNESRRPLAITRLPSSGFTVQVRGGVPRAPGHSRLAVIWGSCL